MKLRLPTIAFLLAWITFPSDSLAFVPQIDVNDQGRIVTISWPSDQAQSGLEYFVNTNSFPFNSNDIDRIVTQSFRAWDELDSVALTFLPGGSGNFRKSSTDRRNVVTYDPSGVEIGAPAGSGVIAITTINWDDQGRITDSDITFNGRDFTFSVTESEPSPGTVDLQDVMTHEVGHLLGLDHSALAGRAEIRPTMNPFASQDAPGEARSLEQDDIAGATALYPAPAATQFGSITGQVMDRDGNPAFGVHVVAYDAETDDFVVGVLSGSAGNNKGREGDGRYEISGLPPGTYRIGIRPVAGAVTEDNIGGIFSRLASGFVEEFYDNVDRLSLAQTVIIEAGRVFGPVDFVLGLTTPGFPQMSSFDLPVNTPDWSGPYPVELTVTDEGGIESVVLRYRMEGGSFVELPMLNESGSKWSASIPGAAPGSEIQYQIVATDNDGNVTAFPPQEANAFTFRVLSLTGEPLIYVVMSGSDVVSVFDSGSGREVARIETGDTPHDAILTPDESILFVANTGLGSRTSRTVTAIETATHRTLATINVGFGPLDVAMSPDGSRLIVTNSDSRSLSVIDTRGLRETTRINLAGLIDGPFGLALSPDGQTAYATDIGASQVYVVDVERGLVTGRINVVTSPRSVVVSPDGRTLYAAGFDGDISVVDLGQELETGRIATPAGVFRVKLSPDGRTLYATDQDGGNLLVIDPATRVVVRTVKVLPAGANSRGLALSEDGSRIYVTNATSNDLVVFDAASLSTIGSFKLGDGPRAILIRPNPLGVTPPVSVIALSDFDADGVIGFGDFLLFAAGFGASLGDPEYDDRFDLDGSGTIDFADFLSFAQVFGRSAVD